MAQTRPPIAGSPELAYERHHAAYAARRPVRGSSRRHQRPRGRV